MSTGGPEFYKKAFIDLDPETLGSDTMKEAFDRMTVIRGFVDDNFSGRDWNLASAMVINGEAAFQFMGDWAKGEFLNAGKVPDQDFLCFRFPGTQEQVTFNSDQFAVFKQGDAVTPEQAALAKAIMSPEFQIAFNKVKGSVPARTDVSVESFDACGQKAYEELKAAAASGNLFGSMAHGHANPASVKNAIYDVITAQFNGEYDAETAVAGDGQRRRAVAVAPSSGRADAPPSRPSRGNTQWHRPPRPAAAAGTGCAMRCRSSCSARASRSCWSSSTASSCSRSTCRSPTARSCRASAGWAGRTTRSCSGCGPGASRSTTC